MKQRTALFVLVAILIFLALGLFWLRSAKKEIIYSPLGGDQPAVKIVDARPLDAYSYENLHKREFVGSEIKLDRVIKEFPNYTTWLFFFSSDGKRISGVLNLPEKLASPSAQTGLSQMALDGANFIVMFHGSVEEGTYYQGFGTEHVAGELAKKGYVTLAPDFAGLGESDKQAEDDFEARFQTYTTVLDLIASVERLGGPSRGSGQIPSPRLGIWGHSNGGQIALSVLEISGKPIPTALWNPVSRFFPYSILYYTDSFDDKGKYLRKVLAKFEEKYDVENYSLVNYLEWINAPILLQQGGSDEWVPKKWSDEFAVELGNRDKLLEYKVYPGADHNLQPRWNEAVGDLIKFYEEKL